MNETFFILLLKWEYMTTALTKYMRTQTEEELQL